MGSNRFGRYEKLREVEYLLEQGEEIDRELLRQKFGLSPSCITDYIAHLKELYGGRLVPRNDGRVKFWRLRRDAESEVTDLTSAASLKFGEITLDVFRGTKYHREVQRLSRHERGRLAVGSAHQLDRFARGLYRRTRGHPDYSDRKEALEAWLDGILANRSLWMRYQRADGTILEYTVEPLVLVLYRERLHLLSRLSSTKQPRTFDLDGVQAVRLEETVFVPPSPEEFDPREVYRHSFGIFSNTGEPPETVQIRVRGVARVRLEQRPVHASQVLGSVDEDGWRSVSLTLCICPEFRSWILGQVPDIRVDGPPSLSTRIRNALATALGQANS